MKAVDFVKKFGLERAKQFVNADHTAHALVFATTGVSFIDLKRLVESWELVAHLSYKVKKEELLKIYAEELVGTIDDRAYNALINYKVEITD